MIKKKLFMEAIYSLVENFNMGIYYLQKFVCEIKCNENNVVQIKMSYCMASMNYFDSNGKILTFCF